jgi:hypothetical protein
MMRFIVACLVGGFLALSTSLAIAQVPAPASAAEVSAFRANSAQWLSGFPSGGAQMESQIQALLAADRSTLGQFIALARTANQDQRTSMAKALAAAAKAYAASEPGPQGFGNTIQQAVAASGIAELARAYAEAAGDPGTAATGGGGGGGGGGPNTNGAPTGGSNTASNTTGSSATSTGTSSLTGGGSLGSATFSEVSTF